MIEAKLEIVVPTPRAKAFAFLSDLENNPKWISGMEWTKKLTDGPIGVGTKLRNRFKERGGFEIDETITAFEENRGFAFDIHVPGMPVHGIFRFEDAGQGTRITFVETVKPEKLAYKLMAPLLGIMIKRQLKRDFAKLETLLASA